MQLQDTLSTHHLQTDLQEQTEIKCNNIFCSFLIQHSQENSGRQCFGTAQKNQDDTVPQEAQTKN